MCMRARRGSCRSERCCTIRVGVLLSAHCSNCIQQQCHCLDHIHKPGRRTQCKEFSHTAKAFLLTSQQHRTRSTLFSSYSSTLAAAASSSLEPLSKGRRAVFGCGASSQVWKVKAWRTANCVLCFDPHSKVAGAWKMKGKVRQLRGLYKVIAHSQRLRC
jgi:hypothetical protein